MPSRHATILIVGGGGREHALAWSLARSPDVEHVYVAPGNGGTSGEPKVSNVGLRDSDLDGLTGFAQGHEVDLVVVGPEAPLALGLTDRMHAAGLTVFGPSRAAARLESSKSWAREFMVRHDVPHPAFTVADDVDAAEQAVRELGGRCVVKADGLAAGKGVLVCDSVEHGLAAVRAVMVEQRFGAAGRRVVIEERAFGQELSIMAATDGHDYVLFPPAQDYKRLADGDQGPNTGGMGSYAPAPAATPEVIAAVRSRVIEPTIAGMAVEGHPFTGCLYCGLMLAPDGPIVIEFNVRFGDPETQAQLPLVGDLFALLDGAARGELRGVELGTAAARAAVCVVLAAAGYPGQAETGAELHGVAEAERVPGVKVLHAGTQQAVDRVVTTGGRALGVVCARDSLADAVAGVYQAIGPAGVRFAGMRYRTDIAARALT